MQTVFERLEKRFILHYKDDYFKIKILQFMISTKENQKQRHSYATINRPYY